MCLDSKVTLVSDDRQTLTVNKYFLLLYDNFFHQLITDHSNDEIQIVFTQMNFSEMKIFAEDVETKHFTCSIDKESKKDSSSEELKIEKVKGKYFEEKEEKMNFSEMKIFAKDVESKHFTCSNDKDKDNDSTTEELKIEKVKEEKLKKDCQEDEEKENNDEHPNTEDESKVRSDSDKEYSCPLNCENSDYTTSIDGVFAHICIFHEKQFYQMGIQRFMNNFSSKEVKQCYFKCKTKNYEENKKLIKHYKDVHTEKSHVCNICGKSYNTKIKLDYHMSVHSSEELMCPECGKVFTGITRFKGHISLHKINPGRYQCDQCDYKCKAIYRLKRHKQVIHMKLKPWACDLCGIRMAAFANLSDHRLKVHGEKFTSVYQYKKLVADGKHKFLKEDEKENALLSSY